MANRKISDLAALTTPASGDYLPIVDISEAAAADKNKRITVEELLRGAPNGTAGAPGIAFEADPNTGIYSPGADQVAISTNGVQRLSIGSSGAITASSTISAGGTIEALQIFQSSSGNDVVLNANGANRDIIYKINGSEKMRLLGSTGALGIGTSSPAKLLHVNASNGDQLLVRSTSTANITGAQTPYMQIDSVGGYTGSGSVTGLLVDISADSTTNKYAAIFNGGRVGIGTTPSYTLDVAGTINSRSADGAAFDALQFYGTAMGTNNKFWRTQITTTDQNWQTVDDAYTTANTWLKATRNGNQVETISFLTGTSGTSERARIDSSGRLLVGTASNSGGALLQINGDRIRVGTAKTPASATDTGTAGEICWDANYVYVCTATNTWKRSALSTW